MGPTLNKDKPSQEQSDNTTNMFNEILIANNCDHESVEAHFELSEQSDSDRKGIKEPV